MRAFGLAQRFATRGFARRYGKDLSVPAFAGTEEGAILA